MLKYKRFPPLEYMYFLITGVMGDFFSCFNIVSLSDGMLSIFVVSPPFLAMASCSDMGVMDDVSANCLINASPLHVWHMIELIPR